MNAFEFGWKLGREKIAIDGRALLSTVGRGISSLGNKMQLHGYKSLRAAAAPGLQQSGMFSEALQSGRAMAQGALRNPLKMVTHPFAFAYRDGLRGQAALGLGRPIAQFGNFITRMGT